VDPVGPHLDGEGGEPFDHQVYVAVLDEVEAELSDAEHALRRLDDGTYGACEVCGDPIGPDRLSRAPAARRCGDHEHPPVAPRLW
jgi:DnaK suppressor protein